MPSKKVFIFLKPPKSKQNLKLPSPKVLGGLGTGTSQKGSLKSNFEKVR